jgi:integrase
MSRRPGQSGAVERSGNFYYVRFWQEQVGQEGRARRRVRLCPVAGPGAMTPAERKRRAREIVHESGANSEQYVRAVFAENLSVTFREQADSWIRHVETRKRNPVKPRTIGNWKSHLAWILPHIGDVPLPDVNQRVAQELVAKMWSGGLRAKTITNYFAVVSMVVASAIGDDGEQLYPRKWNREFLDLPVVDRDAQRTPTFTAQVVENIIGRADYQHAVLYALLPATGLRIGEALGLEVAHFADDSLRVSQSVWNGALYSPKTRNGNRVVDLPANISGILREFIGGRTGGFIFRCANGGPLHQSNLLRRNLHPILEAIGQPKTGFHAFRRFRVTHLRKSGTPEDLLRFWIGHGDRTVTDAYSRLREDVEFRRTVAERVGTGFNAQLIPYWTKPTEDSAAEVHSQTAVM